MDLFDFDFSSDANKSKIIFFDTETTGANSDDQIIEIGAIVEDIDSNLVEYYDELCSTLNSKLISIEAMATHGIRNEDIEDKPSFESSKFWQNIKELNTKDNFFVAHNMPFDLARLEYYGFEPKAKLIDTLQCAKHLFEIDEIIRDYALPNYKLQTFRYILFSKEDEQFEANRFSLNIKAHSALSDVIILKMFFNELLKRVNKSNKLEALNYLVELSTKPVFVKKFAFGKYKGQNIANVAKKDRGYLEWLYRDMKKQKSAGESVDSNMFETLKHYLER